MMPPSRRVSVAFSLSVLLHLILLLVLALISELEPATAELAGRPQEAPLEVILQTEPLASPTPSPALAEATPTPAPASTPTPAPTPELAVVKPLKPELIPVITLHPESIKTQLDPANLKKSDKAPENAKFIASYNSVATAPKPRPRAETPLHPSAKARKTPNETDVAAMEQALLKQSGISSPDLPSLPKPTPIPHPAAKAPFFRTSLPRPTPLSATPTPKPAVAPAPAPAPTPEGAKPSPPPVSGSGTPLAGEVPQGATGEDSEVGIDAIGTWTKAVGNAVGSCWNFYRQSKMDLLVVGDVRIKFLVDARGHVSEVGIITNSANPTNAMYAVRSVREAEIPPIPPERLARVPGGRVAFDVTLTILPTQ